MKLLIVFLIVMVVSLINMSVYSQGVERGAGYSVEMIKIEAEVDEILTKEDTEESTEEIAEEIPKEEIAEIIKEIADEPEPEITKIDIPEDVFARLRMAQSNIDKWQVTMDKVIDKYQIALGNLNLAKLEMKRLWQVQNSEFNLFLVSNDVVDIEYNDIKDWKISGKRAVKK